MDIISSLIIDGKKRSYNRITISKYKKKNAINALYKSILSKNINNSLYFVSELHASGNNNDLWYIFLNIYNNYIHILNFNLPNFLLRKYKKYKCFVKMYNKDKLKYLINLRNEAELRKDLYQICYVLIHSPHKDISHFIPNVKKFTLDVQVSIDYAFNQIEQSIKIKLLQHIPNYDNIDSKMNTFLHLYNIVEQNIIHMNDNMYITIMENFWNIILRNTEHEKILFKQIRSIYEIFIIYSKYKKYNSCNLNNSLYIALLYIFDLQQSYNIIIEDCYKNKDHTKFNVFYHNIQHSINNDIRRYDYIDLNVQNIMRYNIKKTVNVCSQLNSEPDKPEKPEENNLFKFSDGENIPEQYRLLTFHDSNNVQNNINSSPTTKENNIKNIIITKERHLIRKNVKILKK